jgi:putative CocE/NonD family hydrolase
VGRVRVQKLFVLVLLSMGITTTAWPQELDLPEASVKDAAALEQTVQNLAKRVFAKYRERDQEKYLDNLFRLQIVEGQYAEAIATIKSLRNLNKGSPSYAATLYVQYEIFSNAKLTQAAGNLTFADAFQQAFRAKFQALDDKRAYAAAGSLLFDLPAGLANLQASLERQKSKNKIALDEAIKLVGTYEAYLVYKEILPLTKGLKAEDDARRYDIQNDVLIKTKGGATISAVVVRKKGVITPQPAALTFTIYAEEGSYSQAILSAAHGYVGVLAYTRGKAMSPDAIVPYEHESQDGYEVIDWISRQPWSNGQVGMFGGSYNGFTQWATAKKMHPALKTIVPYVAAIPGLGLPMENNVFLNANYGWCFYVTDNQYLDDKTYSDPRRWRSLNAKWYASGRPYREIDQVDGMPNPCLQRWVQHPSFDKYWQDMIPYQEDFATINIPVLTVTGYYDDGQISALQYLKDHYKYNTKANHYLLIGPYDHFGTQRSHKDPILRGYAIDSVAQIDTPEITFEWLDFVMRGGNKPELLKDRINYEVMGQNEWKHAPSINEMSNQPLTFYLTDAKVGDRYRLSKVKPSVPRSLPQVVDLADRKTSNNSNYYPFPIVGQTPNFSTGYAFLSDPFEEPVEVSGTFSGRINAVINKKDMDIGIVLYQVMPNGELFHLSYFLGRASYAADMSMRHLLKPGEVESIAFDRTRMVSRRIEKGSRLLVTLDVNKNAFAEINYGTGEDVSLESINDAKVPLEVKWQTDSFVKIPIQK